MKTIVVGDVHGCIDELHELLDRAGYAEGDRLIFTGDLVDRGPDSAGVVALARKLKAESVMGNHEEKHLRYRMHECRVHEEPGYENPMQPMYPARRADYESLSYDDWDYLEKLPNYIRIGPHFAVVHAGALPGIELEAQDRNSLYRLRYIKKENGKMATLKELREDVGEVDPDKFQFWADVWDGPEILIYGHHVHHEARASIKEQPGNGPHNIGLRALGIDTGCCFGMSLTALVLSSEEKYTRTISVKARKEYHRYRGWGRGEREG
jgi:bis(5'-nucleosyl)-tetraphosphatase (symmetrical)